MVVICLAGIDRDEDLSKAHYPHAEHDKNGSCGSDPQEPFRFPAQPPSQAIRTVEQLPTALEPGTKLPVSKATPTQAVTHDPTRSSHRRATRSIGITQLP